MQIVPKAVTNELGLIWQQIKHRELVLMPFQYDLFKNALTSALIGYWSVAEVDLAIFWEAIACPLNFDESCRSEGVSKPKLYHEDIEFYLAYVADKAVTEQPILVHVQS